MRLYLGTHDGNPGGAALTWIGAIVEEEQWARVLPAVITAFGVLLGVVVTVWKATNRELVAQRRASESLSLMESWEAAEPDGTDSNEVRTHNSLREELRDRALYSTQVYLESTKPFCTSYWQPFTLVILGSLWIWIVFQTQIGPSSDQPWIALIYWLLAFAVVGIAWYLAFQVSRHKEIVARSRRAGSRAASKFPKRASTLRHPTPTGAANAESAPETAPRGVAEGH